MEVMNVESASVGVSETMSRGELEVAIQMAKRHPRTISKFRQDAMSMATIDPEVAMSCFYKLPRGGKTIEGPSIRLAEIAASAWGNLKLGSRVIEVTDTHVVAQGVVFDLERNVSYSMEVRRGIRDKQGYRYNDDMVIVAGNAAAAIALRNAILKAVPAAYIKPIFIQAKRVAIGDAKTLGTRRALMVEEYAKMGITKDQLLAKVDKAMLEDVGLTELETLAGLFTAIRENETTLEKEFPEDREMTAQEKDAASKAKKQRAELVKLLGACESKLELSNAMGTFQNGNGLDIWQKPTHHKDGETFFALLELHENRIRGNISTVMNKIMSAKNAEEFDAMLDQFKKHPELDTQENQDAIIAAGKGLGIQEYFAE